MLVRRETGVKYEEVGCSGVVSIKNADCRRQIAVGEQEADESGKGRNGERARNKQVDFKQRSNNFEV